MVKTGTTFIIMTMALGLYALPTAGHTKEFYEGGTLHKATIEKWHKSTPANRLATASDFAVGILGAENFSNMEEVKHRATELIICIDTGTKNTPHIQNDKVSDVAIICAILMGWGKE